MEPYQTRSLHSEPLEQLADSLSSLVSPPSAVVSSLKKDANAAPTAVSVARIAARGNSIFTSTNVSKTKQ